jgi:hypothetical protein
MAADFPIKPKPERYSRLSRSEIETAITEITAAMKRPMADLERRLYYADRVDLRAALALLPKT